MIAARRRGAGRARRAARRRCAAASRPRRREPVRTLRRHRRRCSSAPAPWRRWWSCSTTCNGAIRPRSSCCGSSSPGCGAASSWSSRCARSRSVSRDDVTDALGAIARDPVAAACGCVGLSLAATGAAARVARPTEPVSAELRGPHPRPRAEGNPFYTLELARLLDEPGGRRRGAGDACATRSGVGSACCRDRRSSCSPSPRSSAATSTCRRWPRSRGIELDECVDRLDPAAECRMLVADATAATSLRFSHALVREVLVDGLTPLRRAQLHLQVADAIEQRRRRQRRHRAARRPPVARRRARRRRAGRRRARACRRRRRRPRRLHVGRGAPPPRGPAPPSRRRFSRCAAGPAGRPAAPARGDAGDPLLLRHRPRPAPHDPGARHAGSVTTSVSRELSWSEWAALSRRADVAEAGTIAERYVAQWGDDRARASERARAIVARRDGVEPGRDRRRHRPPRPRRVPPARRPPPSSPLEREQPLIAESFRLYCHAAHGTMSPERALAGFDELLDALPPTAVDGRHQLVLALACRSPPSTPVGRARRASSTGRSSSTRPRSSLNRQGVRTSAIAGGSVELAEERAECPIETGSLGR